MHILCCSPKSFRRQTLSKHEGKTKVNHQAIHILNGRLLQIVPGCNLRAVAGMQNPAGGEGVGGKSGALIFPRIHS